MQMIETLDEETKELRYERPNVTQLEWNDTNRLNRSQLEFLVGNLPDGTAESLLAHEALLEIEQED